MINKNDSPQQQNVNELLVKIGDLCHGHYLKSAYDANTDQWEYYYDTEVTIMLKDDLRIAAAIQKLFNEARLQGANDLARRIKAYDWQLEDSINANDTVAETIEAELIALKEANK